MRKELKMKEHRMTILLLVTVVLLATTVPMARIKCTEQTPSTTLDHQFLVSLRPEEIQWKLSLMGLRWLYSQATPQKQANRLSFASSIETA